MKSEEFLEMFSSIVSLVGTDRLSSVEAGEFKVRFREPTEGETQVALFDKVEGQFNDEMRGRGPDELEENIERLKMIKELDS